MVQPGVLGIPIEVNSLYKILADWYRYVGCPLHLNAQNTSVAYNEFDFVIRLSTLV